MSAKKLQWHPFAKCFPMMDAEDLKELAEDIKSNGLKFPIVLDKMEWVSTGETALKPAE